MKFQRAIQFYAFRSPKLTEDEFDRIYDRVHAPACYGHPKDATQLKEVEIFNLEEQWHATKQSKTVRYGRKQDTMRVSCLP